MNGSRVEIDGLGYLVREAGNPNGPLVLMMHGWPDDGLLWRNQAGSLADAGFRVVAPDLPGFGQTDRPATLKRYEAERIGADMVKLLDHYQIEKAHLVAHDYGAVTGWALALGSPERLLSFTACSVGHFGALADTALGEIERHWYFFAYQLPVASRLFRADNGRLLRFLTASHPDQEQVVGWLLESDNLEAAWKWDYANPVADYIAQGLEGAFSDLPPVSVPTMGIYGTDDYFLSAAQMRATEKFMGARWRYEQIEGGHWFMLTNPDATNRLLLDWLENLP